jgi:hypothetical protein
MVFHAWAKELGIGSAYQTADLISEANNHGMGGAPVHPDLREALLDVARDRRGDAIDARRLGKWLSSNADNIADDLKLSIDRGDVHRPRWVLRAARQQEEQ